MNSRNFVLAMYAKFQPEAKFPDTASSDKVINDHTAYVDSLDLEGLKRWIESFVNDGKGQKGSLAQSDNEQYRQAKEAYKALQQALS